MPSSGRWTSCASCLETPELHSRVFVLTVSNPPHSAPPANEQKPAGTPELPVIGAAPMGSRDPQSAARTVREMFTAIAPRYDLLNHLLSFNVDRWWWRRTARTFAHVL